VSIFSISSTETQIPSNKRGFLAMFGLFAGVSLLGATGCVAEVETRPAYVTYSAGAQPVVVEDDDTVAYIEEAPVVNIETYPSVYYGGRYVYWVDNQWYYRGPRGWCYYRSEPRALVSYRVDYERRYPGTYARVGGRVYERSYNRTRVEATPVRASTSVHREYAPSRPVVRASGSVHAGAKASGRSSSSHHR